MTNRSYVNVKLCITHQNEIELAAALDKMDCVITAPGELKATFDLIDIEVTKTEPI